jgi:hypothetical protein
MKAKIWLLIAIAALGFCTLAQISTAWAQTSPAPDAATAGAETSAPRREGASAVEDDDLDDLPPDVRARLSSEQLFQLLKARSNRDAAGSAKTIVVPSVFFLTTFLIVAAALYAGYRKDRQRHETLRLAIERGANIPPELITPPRKRGSDLKRGILLMSTGIALAILLSATATERGVWTVALIPTLLGLGYLVVYKLEGKRNDGPVEPPSYRATGA